MKAAEEGEEGQLTPPSAAAGRDLPSGSPGAAWVLFLAPPGLHFSPCSSGLGAGYLGECECMRTTAQFVPILWGC